MTNRSTTKAPFSFVQIGQAMFLGITEHLKVLYRVTCSSWNGSFDTPLCVQACRQEGCCQTIALATDVQGQIAYHSAKFKDLQVLKASAPSLLRNSSITCLIPERPNRHCIRAVF
ncbi:hypothetical protein PoB_002142300 [Plakobranchus ocellatus]|uniref:BPTI/Kunitz inhibitor domain-containing protein n=1 Tax=Plakobranchus ocellatus TaxID=259542 RepID=A0AAV3ZK61_9GAST|nr:hypothetical protein PoB_002142300 [Plakobranchus ocellatus]